MKAKLTEDESVGRELQAVSVFLRVEGSEVMNYLGDSELGYRSVRPVNDSDVLPEGAVRVFDSSAADVAHALIRLGVAAVKASGTISDLQWLRDLFLFLDDELGADLHERLERLESGTSPASANIDNRWKGNPSNE